MKNILRLNMSKKKNSKKDNLPLVSVCTPTFNRRPFIEYMIKCFQHQTYPKKKLEWIIIDDGTDKIEDLLKHIEQVKYYKYEGLKMTLGEKRNLMHTKCSGDIIVYMDDDDYYPPERITHAVEMLQSKKEVLCAGSSEMYIYYKEIDKMYKFGPYGPKHATAGTFAFKKELLKNTRYNDSSCLAEEKEFLNNYTVPFIQLDPMKTILVFSHEHNTFDKRRLLENINPQYVKLSTKKVEDFIKNKDIEDFYVNRIGELLTNYDIGKPYMKPDVLKQIKELEEERKQMYNKSNNVNENTKIVLYDENRNKIEYTLKELIILFQKQSKEINILKNIIKGKDIEIKLLQDALEG